MRPFIALLLLCAAPGCATRPPGGGVVSVGLDPAYPDEAWRQAAQAEDATRLDAMPTAWARATARLAGRALQAKSAEGTLLDPAAGLDHPELPPGSYNCRVVRLGDSAGTARLRSFPANFCYVMGADGKELSFAKQTGSDLPAGRLYPAGDRRYVFLGARQAKAGDTSTAYGSDPTRDVAGVIERIGAFRWRLVVPARDSRSLDVYELTPVPVERQPG